MTETVLYYHNCPGIKAVCTTHEIDRVNDTIITRHYDQPKGDVISRFQGAKHDILGLMYSETHYLLQGKKEHGPKHRVLHPAWMYSDSQGVLTETHWFNKDKKITDDVVKSFEDMEIPFKLVGNTDRIHRVDLLRTFTPGEETYLMMRHW